MRKYQLLGLTIILTIFLLGTLSAGIYKDVQDEKNIKIKDKYWIDVFGWFAEDVAEYKLDKNYYSILDGWAEGSVTLYKNGRLFNKINFYGKDKKTKKVLEKSEIYIGVNKTKYYEEPIYSEEDECNYLINGYKNCNKNIISYKNKTYYEIEWKKYNGEILKGDIEGITYYWKIHGKRKSIKTGVVDWIANVFGEDLDEWAVWWNNSWAKKKEIKIKENSGNNLTNYSVLIYVNYDADMQSDFDDLRFLNSTETGELEYWIKNKVDGSYAEVWVKVDELTENINNSIYMYYGNAGVSSNSDFENTFLFADDFEDGTAGNQPPGWTIQENVGTIRVSTATAVRGTKSVKIDDTGSQSARLYGYAQLPSDLESAALHFSANSDNSLTYISTGLDDATLETGITGTLPSSWALRGNNVDWIYWSESTSVNGGTIISSGWENFSMTFNLTDYTDISQNNVTKVSLDKLNFEPALYRYIQIWMVGGGASSHGYFDDIYIRKYSEPEPTYVIGDEISWEIFITLNSPENYANLTSQDVTFNCTARSDDINLVNVSLYIDGVLNETNSSGINNSNYIFEKTLSDGNYNWTCSATNDENYTTTADYRYFEIDTIYPQINISYPTGTIDYINTNETLNATITDTNLDTCWYNYNGTNITFSCTNGTLSTEYFNLTTSSNSQSITVYANDTLGNENSTTQNWTYKILENERTFTSSIFETEAETYSINVSANSSLTSIKLHWNNTNYTMTEESEGYWTYSRDMPLGTGDYPFYFIFTYAEETITSINSTQEVNLTLFTPTNATYSDVFLNLSFKDENDLSWINASIPTSTFIYYLGSGSVNKTLSFSNNTNNYYYAFSGTTGDKDLYVIPEVQYRQVSDYPQRIWQPAIQTYNSTQEDKILYLLSSNDGIYVTYQVLTAGENPIQGVSVVSTRQVSGETVQIGAGETDAAGTITFWMNPDFQHTTTFNKEGYDEYVFTHYPTQASYTITLGSQVEEEASCTNGISYTIKPSENFLWQNQVYDFNFTLSSSYWNLTSIQITLKDEDGVNLGSDSSTNPSGATLSINDINISNNTVITMTYLYELDPDEDDGECGQISSQREWITQSITGREYSIWYLSEQAKLYISAGMWGIDDFGKTVISFIIIVLLVGGISMRYGIASEGAIMGILFGIVYLLDFGLNLIPKVQIGDIVSIDHYLTFITFIILFIIILKEEMKA